MSRFRNFSPRAAADLDHAVGWLLDHGAGASAAERLLAAVLDAGERLASRPQLGRRLPDLLPDPFRFWSLPRVGLLIVYDATSAPVTILRVLSTAQELGPLLTDIDPPDRGDPD